MSVKNPGRRLRILTWHVHGNYLYYLSQVPHDFYLVTDASRSEHHSGRSGALPWGDNVYEAPVEAVPDMRFDAILFQSRPAWEKEQHQLLTAEQRRLPRLYLEHDPPLEEPTDTKHWVDDPEVMLVHVTAFNALMWDNGRCPVRVVEHGVSLLERVSYLGEVESGLVVINNLAQRGRRLGRDLFEDIARQVPLSLVGMNSELCGGAGEVPQTLLPERLAAHRFFFHPARYTSLGLAVIEAMMVGAPVVGLATTELVTVIRNGENGIIDTRPERLTQAMRDLLRDPAEAHRLGAAGRRLALDRFHIDRFVGDWLALFKEVCA